MEEKLLNPIIKIPKGCCPRCLSNLTVFESEIVEFELDSDGLPIKHDTLYNRQYGKCKSCGLEFEVVKNGMGFSTKSRLVEILNEEYLNYLVKEENPFTK